jgi:hypothetical protein
VKNQQQEQKKQTEQKQKHKAGVSPANPFDPFDKLWQSNPPFPRRFFRRPCCGASIFNRKISRRTQRPTETAIFRQKIFYHDGPKFSSLYSRRVEEESIGFFSVWRRRPASKWGN